jgi:hypothetical protein
MGAKVIGRWLLFPIGPFNDSFDRLVGHRVAESQLVIS